IVTDSVTMDSVYELVRLQKDILEWSFYLRKYDNSFPESSQKLIFELSRKLLPFFVDNFFNKQPFDVDFLRYFIIVEEWFPGTWCEQIFFEWAKKLLTDFIVNHNVLERVQLFPAYFNNIFSACASMIEGRPGLHYLKTDIAQMKLKYPITPPIVINPTHVSSTQFHANDNQVIPATEENLYLNASNSSSCK
ncbi:MAG: hypothetical protein ACK4PR_04610, partial [Gammaproteobacteria bacterium]